jgi:hypothetical protein
MKKVQIISGVLSVLVVIPIWYYLFYKILCAVQATELMWFLFWVYIPFAVISQILSRIVEK